MELLEKDEEYIISLLEQGKKVEATAFVKDNFNCWSMCLYLI